MPPVVQYVFAETPGISGRFTAGRHECLPYSAFPTFSKQTCKHQFVALRVPEATEFDRRDTRRFFLWKGHEIWRRGIECAGRG